MHIIVLCKLRIFLSFWILNRARLIDCLFCRTWPPGHLCEKVGILMEHRHQGVVQAEWAWWSKNRNPWAVLWMLYFLYLLMKERNESAILVWLIDPLTSIFMDLLAGFRMVTLSSFQSHGFDPWNLRLARVGVANGQSRRTQP